jgi:predicted methyltransferase
MANIKVGYSNKDILLVGEKNIVGIGLSLNPPEVYSIIDTTTRMLRVTDEVESKLSTNIIGLLFHLNNESPLNPIHVLNALKKMDENIKHSF